MNSYKNTCTKLKKDMDDIKRELDAKKAAEDAKITVEENKNTFLPIIPMHSITLFRVLLTIFSYFIYFKLIDINLSFLIFNLPEVVIPWIITIIAYFVWESYRLYSKVRKYYKAGKIIYMFCIKNIYSLDYNI